MTESASLGHIQDGIRVETSIVSCDGRSPQDPLGHPRVYLAMGEDGRVTCPYCSRHFILVEQPTYKG